jgi:electron transfer flavoprotein alpha subunit
VANVLCVVELNEGRALPVCLEVLGQARRLSTSLGATLYAVVPLGRAPRYGEDDIIAVLGRHGADKVILVTDEALGDRAAAMRWGSHGPAIVTITEALPPSLVLFGATAGARDVAPRIAARLGAAYLHDAWVELDGGDAGLALWEDTGDGGEARALPLPDGLEFPVVATIPPGRYEIAQGAEDVEVEIVPVGAHATDFDELGWQADPRGRAAVYAPQAHEAARAALSEALGGGDGRNVNEAVRLLISLDGEAPSSPLRADVRVAIGSAAETSAAHYALVGDAGAGATALATAIGRIRDGEDVSHGPNGDASKAPDAAVPSGTKDAAKDAGKDAGR